jgi:hypothetical protein
MGIFFCDAETWREFEIHEDNNYKQFILSIRYTADDIQQIILSPALIVTYHNDSVVMNGF